MAAAGKAAPWEAGDDDGGDWLESALVDEVDSCVPGSEPLALFVCTREDDDDREGVLDAAAAAVEAEAETEAGRSAGAALVLGQENGVAEEVGGGVVVALGTAGARGELVDGGEGDD